jgi:citrate synthase
VRALGARKPGRTLAANIDLWVPVVLDGLGVRRSNVSAVLAACCTAGWCTHIYEQVRSKDMMLRPDDVYQGIGSRSLSAARDA